MEKARKGIIEGEVERGGKRIQRSEGRRHIK